MTARPSLVIFAGQTPGGPEHRRGAVGYASSPDLETWTFHAPLFNPGTTLTPECPEYFELDGTHYLIWSSYSERFATRYRIADRFEGPWRAPDTDDAFDSNDIYAATPATPARSPLCRTVEVTIAPGIVRRSPLTTRKMRRSPSAAFARATR